MDSKRNFESLDDQQLVAAINEGNEAAFEALYYRHRDWVVNLAYRWTEDHELSLDVLQETFFYVAGKFPGFRLTAKFQTFLFPVVRNLSLTARRKSPARRAEIAGQNEMSQDAPTPCAGENLEMALRSLSAGHRDVVLLRFVDDLSLEEIADVLGLPLGTVKSRLHNALQTMRQDARTREYFER